MSSLGDTMSYSIAIFVIFVSFTLALFQNIGVMDPNNHFMGTSPTVGQDDQQIHDMVNSTTTSNTQSTDLSFYNMAYLFITTVIGGLYNAVIGLSGWLTKFYVPPIMAAGIQIAIDANFAYDLWILWKHS